MALLLHISTFASCLKANAPLTDRKLIEIIKQSLSVLKTIRNSYMLFYCEREILHY
jgi:hypothetical protein